MHFPSACSKRLGIVWRKLLHPKTKEKVSEGVTPQQGLVGCWGRPRAAPGSLLAAGGAQFSQLGRGLDLFCFRE